MEKKEVKKEEKEKKVRNRNKNDKNMHEKNVFNIQEVVIIMIVTAICSITMTIKVTFVNNNSSQKIKTEAELSELIDVYNSIKKEYYKEVDKKELVDSAIEGMLDYLDDPYTVLLNEVESDNLNKELDGKYVGLGAEIASSDGSFIVNKVYDNSPAMVAGMKEKDIITKIRNDSLSGVDINDLAGKLKAKNGDKVPITVKRNGVEIVLNVTIGNVEIQSVSYKVVKNNNKNIASISIKTFAKNTFEQFKKVCDNFEKDNIDGIIIDLRGNTGGHLTVSQSIAELFLNKNDIIYKLSNKNGVTEVKNVKNKKVNKPVVLIVNGQTASASEILTAALKENINAEVVGIKTYGKGKVQKIQKLSNGLTVKYTVQNWLTPSGKEIDKNGIEPTIEEKMNDEYNQNPIIENDNQYKKALEIISNK